MKTYYRGHANIGCYQLTSQDCETGQTNPTPLAPVTKMELTFSGNTYDSDADPQAFDWSVNPSNGRLNLKVGLLTDVPIGRDTKSELIVYDPSNPEGVVWGLLAINVIDVQ